MPQLNLNGFTDVPRGKLATVVTHLDMRAPPPWLAAYRPPQGFGCERRERPDTGWYRALFRAVGEDWLWFSRAGIGEEQLAGIIHDERVEVYAIVVDGAEAGLLELDFRQSGQCELAFVGLKPGFAGRGFGRALMAEGLKRAWRTGIDRVWIHTCTLDSPVALMLYQKCGFVPYARQIEIVDDPRLTGALRRDAGQHVPLLP